MTPGGISRPASMRHQIASKGGSRQKKWFRCGITRREVSICKELSWKAQPKGRSSDTEGGLGLEVEVSLSFQNGEPLTIGRFEEWVVKMGEGNEGRE